MTNLTWLLQKINKKATPSISPKNERKKGKAWSFLFFFNLFSCSEHCTVFHVGRKAWLLARVHLCLWWVHGAAATCMVMPAVSSSVKAQTDTRHFLLLRLSDRKPQIPHVQPESSQGGSTTEIQELGSCLSWHLVGLCVILDASAASFHHPWKTMTKNKNNYLN